MSETRTKYFKIKSSELCIKNETEKEREQLYRFKSFLEQLDPDTLPKPSIKNTNKIVLVSLNDNYSEFFTRHKVVLQEDYLTGTGMFIKQDTILEEIEKYQIGEFYDGLSTIETDTIRDLIDEFQEMGEEAIIFHQNIFERNETIKQKHLGTANMLISRYRVNKKR